MDEAKCTTHANRRHAISAPQPRRWPAFVLAPRLRGGNRRCKRGALSCCPLQAERISLIGGAEFVVPQRCNFPTNRLIQRDILADGSGFRVERSRFSLHLCALALAGPRRWSEQALPCSAQPLWFRRRLLFVGCRADALHDAVSDLAPTIIGSPIGPQYRSRRTTGLPGGPQAGPTLLRPLAKIGLNDDEDLRHPLLRAECNRSAHQKMDLGKPR